MARPTQLVRMALRTRRQPVPFSVNEATENQARAKCILLHDVRRTALPSDIQRALLDAGAVDSSFSVSSITSLPPSLPKNPSLYRTYHLTLPSAKKATELSNTLSSKPIFSTTNTKSSRSSSPSSSSSSSQGGNQRNSQAQLTHQSSIEWTHNLITKTLQDRSIFEKQRDKQLENQFTPDWSLKSGLSGRRVIIKGLPGSIKDDDVKKLGKDCGVGEEWDSCVKLPSSRKSQVSTFCLITNTVNDAHRLARKIHMKWYKVDVYGQRWLMRAHVHY